MDWFLNTDYPFAMFSPQHLIPIAFTVYSIVFLYQNPAWFYTHRSGIRYGLSLILILLEMGLYGWYWSYARFSLEQSLPLQLCSVSYILTIWMLLRPSYRIYEFLYFAGMAGALQALLTPAAILSGFPHFTYFYFFIGHSAIIWVALYMTWVHEYRPEWGSIWRALLALNVLLMIVWPVNQVTGGNYLFVNRKPEGDTLLNYLGPWPWYLISLELVAIVLFVLMYLPFIRSYKRARIRL